MSEKGLIKSMWTGLSLGVNGALVSSSGDVLGPGDGGDDLCVELDAESEEGDTTVSSSWYVVYDGGGSFEGERWESTDNGSSPVPSSSRRRALKPRHQSLSRGRLFFIGDTNLIRVSVITNGLR